MRLLEDWLNTIILGLIQGLAEWLPISSTAHLKIAETLLGLSATPLLSITLHTGTLVVVIFYFRRDIWEILSALGRLDFKSEQGRFVSLIIVATIPTGIIGLLYVQLLESSFQTFMIIGATFLVGATVLYASRVGKEVGDTVSYRIALIIGAAQGFAIFPGLSRSGITISSGMLLGVKREKAFKFSFLLSIPAILGDLLIETYKQRGQLALQPISPADLLIGIAVTIATGYLAIRLVSNLVSRKRFHYFAFYTWPLGIALIALSLFF